MRARNVLLLLSLIPLLAGGSALAATPELGRLLAEIQKTSPGSPKERDLQKAVIALVQKMKTPPPVPEEARRRMVRGEAFVEAAKDKSGYDGAIREFRAAVREAPWLPQPYYNLGIVQEKAGQYDAAKESLELYLLANPKAGDARQVRDLIYKLEARKELAGKQQAEQKRQEQARLTPPPKPLAPDLNGLWRVRSWNRRFERPIPRGQWGSEEKRKARVDARGGTFRAELLEGGWRYDFQGRLAGDTVRGTLYVQGRRVYSSDCSDNWNVPFEGKVLDGGRTIMLINLSYYAGGPRTPCRYVQNLYLSSFLLFR